MRSEKLFFCDLETTGINPYRSGIVEIAYIIRVGDFRKTFQSYVKPYPSDEINPEALSVNKLRQTDLESFPEPQHVYNQIIDELSIHVDKYNKKDKFFFIGYNSVVFDAPFLRKFFEKAGDKYFGSYFFYPPLDVMQQAAFHLYKTRQEMVNFKLTTVARELGIEVDESKAHGALYDTELTEAMYDKLILQ